MLQIKPIAIRATLKKNSGNVLFQITVISYKKVMSENPYILQIISQKLLCLLLLLFFCRFSFKFLKNSMFKTVQIKLKKKPDLKILIFIEAKMGGVAFENQTKKFE